MRIWFSCYTILRFHICEINFDPIDLMTDTQRIFNHWLCDCSLFDNRYMYKLSTNLIYRKIIYALLTFVLFFNMCLFNAVDIRFVYRFQSVLLLLRLLWATSTIFGYLYAKSGWLVLNSFDRSLIVHSSGRNVSVDLYNHKIFIYL